MESVPCIVTGATGWLGIETVKILQQQFCNSSDIYLIGSKPQELEISNRKYRITSFSNTDTINNLNLYFDYAFVSKFKFISMGKTEYINQNTKIINDSSRLIIANKPKTVILASSGAVYKLPSKKTDKVDYVYAELKLKQEEEIRKACEVAGSNLIICRIFNLSGSGLVGRNNFALPEFIEKSLANEKILITSINKVYRRYCDITQLINLLIKMGLNGENIVFDSGGEIVEILELAHHIVKIIDSNSLVTHLGFNQKESVIKYLSNSAYFENLVCTYLSEEPATLSQQLVNSINFYTKASN
jgi:nucleoside-diphosphate-sugar epimerase